MTPAMAALKRRLKTKHRKRLILQRWDAGENYVDIANSLDMYPWTVRRIIEFARMFVAGDTLRRNYPSGKFLHRKNRDRDAAIVRERKAGTIWREIAEKHKLSPERVRQIYGRHLRYAALPKGASPSAQNDPSLTG